MNKFGMYGVWILVIMVGIAISVTLTLAPMTLITEDDLGKIPRGDGYLDAAAFQVAVSDNSFASQLIKDFKAAPPKDLLQGRGYTDSITLRAQLDAWHPPLLLPKIRVIKWQVPFLYPDEGLIVDTYRGPK